MADLEDLCQTILDQHSKIMDSETGVDVVHMRLLEEVVSELARNDKYLGDFHA